MITDSPLTPIVGGYRITSTATHHIDALRMMFNWRVVTTPRADPTCYDRHWCYTGNDVETLVRVVGAVLAWMESGDDEPAGWSKNGQTGEWREHACLAASEAR